MSASRSGRRALITGASSGIGYELARVFARESWDLILVARRQDKLSALARELGQTFGVDVAVIEKDLSQTGAAQELFRETQSRQLTVDALVNNAGFGAYGLFGDADVSNLTDMLELNIVTLTKLTRLYVQPMIERRKGWIMNVASTAAFLPGPLMAVYYASKAYVLSLSEALANEFKAFGISVTALCPGGTVSGFQEVARMQSSKLLEHGLMPTDRVAEEGYRGMMRGRSIVIPGLKNKVMIASVRLVPRSVVPAVVRKIQEARS